MPEWIQQLHEFLDNQRAVVLVTVVSVKGSTPREAGAKMLVTAQSYHSTIGGGHLEYKAIEIARRLLQQASVQLVRRFTLGAGLGQCCGGVVTLLFEYFDQKQDWMNKLKQYQCENQSGMQIIPLQDKEVIARSVVRQTDLLIMDRNNKHLHTQIHAFAYHMLHEQRSCQVKSFVDEQGARHELVFDPIKPDDFNVYVFGAGHVGTALVSMLLQQECRVTWVDTRDEMLQREFINIKKHQLITCCTDTPLALVDEAPANSYFIVMTHDHHLDQQLSEHILKREDVAWFGLIGSATKRKKFEHRMLRRGLSAQKLKTMTCPIGIDGIKSKQPAAIALAVTAQLVQVHEQRAKNGLELTVPGQQATG